MYASLADQCDQNTNDFQKKMDDDVNKMKPFTKKTNNKAPLVLYEGYGVTCWFHIGLDQTR